MSNVSSHVGKRAIEKLQWLFPLTVPAEIWLTLFVFAGVFKGNSFLASLLGSVDLTVILGGMALLSLIFERIMIKRHSQFRILGVDVWLLIFSAIMLAGAVFISGNATYGIQKTGQFVLLGVLASYFLPRVIMTLRSNVEVFIKRIFATLVVAAGISSLIVLLGMVGSTRSLGGSYLSWGYFLGVAIIADIGLLALVQRRISRLLLMAILPAMIVALVFARGRGPTACALRGMPTPS